MRLRFGNGGSVAGGQASSAKPRARVHVAETVAKALKVGIRDHRKAQGNDGPKGPCFSPAALLTWE